MRFIACSVGVLQESLLVYIQQYSSFVTVVVLIVDIYLSTFRSQVFTALLLLSALFFALAFGVGMPMITVRPQKFAISFTMGSILFMGSFGILKGPAEHLSKLVIALAPTQCGSVRAVFSLGTSLTDSFIYREHVQGRPNVFHNDLRREHADNAIFHVHSRRSKGVPCCFGCIGHSAAGVALLFDQFPSWRSCWFQDTPGSHVPALEAGSSRVRKVSGNLHGKMLQFLG